MGATQRRARAKPDDLFFHDPIAVSTQSQTPVAIIRKSRRALRGIVWAARAVGWVLVALAIVNALSLEFSGPLPLEGGLKLLVSLVLGVLSVAWIVGLELFLRFFDRYLSRN